MTVMRLRSAGVVLSPGENFTLDSLDLGLVEHCLPQFFRDLTLWAQQSHKPAVQLTGGPARAMARFDSVASVVGDFTGCLSAMCGCGAWAVDGHYRPVLSIDGLDMALAQQMADAGAISMRVDEFGVVEVGLNPGVVRWSLVTTVGLPMALKDRRRPDGWRPRDATKLQAILDLRMDGWQPVERGDLAGALASCCEYCIPLDIVGSL